MFDSRSRAFVAHIALISALVGGCSDPVGPHDEDFRGIIASIEPQASYVSLLLVDPFPEAHGVSPDRVVRVYLRTSIRSQYASIPYAPSELTVGMYVSVDATAVSGSTEPAEFDAESLVLIEDR